MYDVTKANNVNATLFAQARSLRDLDDILKQNIGETFKISFQTKTGKIGMKIYVNKLGYSNENGIPIFLDEIDCTRCK